MGDPMKKTIYTQELTFQYDEAVVLDHLSIAVEQGDFLTIIGPNGSGKSTLLKLLSAHLKPQSGVVRLGDRDIHSFRKRELAQEMGVVPQETGVSYDFQAYDIVLMGRNPHIGRFQREQAEDHRIVREVMEWTNTWHLRDRNVNQLSGGERQRVIIARALAQCPKVILLDEPVSALDIHHQIEVLELLKRLNRQQGVTIIAVLHDLNLAARYSDSVLLLHQGRKITMGKTEEVLTVENLREAYQMEMIIQRNPYTQGLMVHPIRKCLPQEERRRKTKIHLICGGGTGRGLINTLLDSGFPLTMGALNQGDSDWELGFQLGIPMAIEKPFCEMGSEALAEAMKMIEATDCVILSNVPLGWGNINNLQLIARALEIGKRAYYLREHQFHNDFVQGKATAMLEALKEQGMKEFSDLEELVKELIKNDE